MDKNKASSAGLAHIPSVGNDIYHTITGTAPCLNDASVATLTINPQPNAGADGATTVCDNSSTAIDLFSLITGEQSGGVWTRTTGSGGTFNAGAGAYTPAVGATTSTFTYTITGTAPCGNDASVATITVNPSPVISPLTINCTGSTLNTVVVNATVSVGTLEYQVDGLGYQASNTFSGLSTGNHTFDVRVLGSLCTASTGSQSISCNCSVVSNNTISADQTICEGDIPTGLTGSLPTITPVVGFTYQWEMSTNGGGSWTDVLGGTSQNYSPATLTQTTEYRRKVLITGCPESQSNIVTITVNPQSNAGADGATTVCDNSSTSIDLFSLITGEQSGGVWTRTTGSGGTFNAGAGTYTPAVGATTSTFTYTITGTAPCGNDASVATVTINPQPNAGADGATTVCDNSSTAIDLFSLITGEQSGGVWTRTTGSGGTFNAGAGTYTPAVGATTSTFTYTITGTAPCGNDASVATVTINPQPNAGADGATTVCDNSSTAIDLFSLITGEQSGGVWTRTTGSGGTFNAGAGTYTPAVGATTSTFTYTITGTAPCGNSS